MRTLELRKSHPLSNGLEWYHSSRFTYTCPNCSSDIKINTQYSSKSMLSSDIGSRYCEPCTMKLFVNKSMKEPAIDTPMGTNPSTNTCTCDKTQVPMITGCTCGAITPFRLRL